ncbi:MAG: sigma-54 dependent transcriptional regulator [Chitinophagales bacterium]|nr:sigma-54 dependent transcriptional regulator [Chitinophagales bacterium]
MMARVLIIDDEEKLRGLLARIISLEGYEVEEAGTAKAALKKVEQTEFDAIICDVRLPDESGITLTAKIKALSPVTEIIVLTAYGTIEDGVQAIKQGAFDYITKGDDNEKIIPLLNRAVDKALLRRRIDHLEKKVGDRYSFENIIGTSVHIQDAITLAKKVAATDATVLLTGETGTGKEVFAQAIHYGGARRNRNFVAVNCAAISREILESELFGHKAGAFTGAVKDTQGLFDEANEGTIFLDEISEMNIELQAKLLRVLETKEFNKVGESKPTKVNVRVIAATNRDLQKEIESGNFRSDLYYRLAVFQIHLPALRERVADIEPLADCFIQLFASKVNRPAPKMSSEFLAKLKSYTWKGNIRELKNVMERAVILCDNQILNEQDLPFEIQSNIQHSTQSSPYDLSLVEKQHIHKVLLYTKGNKAEAARLMNIGLTTLYRKIEEYQL